MKRLFILPLTVSLLCLTACSNSSEDATADNAVSAADSVSITPPSREEMFSEQEIRNMDRNYAILLKYIKINEDSLSYTLDISEEDAVKAGVDKEYYHSVLESVRSTNEALKEASERGDSILPLLDFQKSAVSPDK